jgi:hypothetical protein
VPLALCAYPIVRQFGDANVGGNFRHTAVVALAGFCLAAPVAAQKVPADLMKNLPPKIDTTPDADAKNRVVVGAMIPIPDVGEGAPLFTSSDLGQMQAETQRLVSKSRSDLRRCGALLPPQYEPGHPGITNLVAREYEAGQRVIASAGKAEAATLKAEDARRAAFSGNATKEEVEARELDRQAAIVVLQKARAELVEAQAMIGDAQKMIMSSRPFDWLELRMKEDARRRDDVGLGVGKPQDFTGLDIAEVKAQQFKDAKGGQPFVRVSGKIVNSNNKVIKIPALSVALVDERGWVMGNQTVTPVSKKGIGSNKSEPFQIDVRPAPDLLQTALVTFAPKAQIQPRLGVGYFCSGARD